MSNYSGRPPLVIVAGPTAVGKSTAAIAVASELHGGIVSADSMQVYRGMDIGTAKVMPAEQQGVPHALIDILEPEEPWNVVLFQQRASEAIRQYLSEGRLPILCGGTGFYIQALLYGIDFTAQAEDPAYRVELEEAAERRAEETGRPVQALLHEALAAVDPVSAAAIPAGNRRRVIRALEYYHVTGQTISAHNEAERQKEPVYDAVYFVLTMDRQRLYARIDQRVDEMLRRGLEEEVRRLKERGLTAQTQSMQGLGYRQMLSCLDGKCTLEEAADAIRNETRHFAKRQGTWFRREQKRNPALIEVDCDAFRSSESMTDWMIQQVRQHYGI